MTKIKEFRARSTQYTDRWLYWPVLGTAPIGIIDGTLGQFTGFLDPKGNKIFEHDILLYIKKGEGGYSEIHYYPVFWNEKRGCWSTKRIITDKNGDKVEQIESLYKKLAGADHVVGGNLYENPDFIE